MTLRENTALSALGAIGMQTVRRPWRICNDSAIDDGIHTFALIINNQTGYVCGLCDDGTMLSMADVNLGDFLDDGAKITIARVQHGYTQRSLAEAIGVTPLAVTFWERGYRTPSAKNRAYLKKLLNVEIGE